MKTFFAGLEEAFGNDKRLADSFLLLPVPSTRVMQQNPGCQLENLMQKYNSVEIMLANQSIEKNEKTSPRPGLKHFIEERRRDNTQSLSNMNTSFTSRPNAHAKAPSVASFPESDDVKVFIVIIIRLRFTLH